MQVGRHDVVHPGSLDLVGAVVAVAVQHTPERRLARAEDGGAGVIFVAHDGAEVGVQHYRPNHSAVVALGSDVQNPQARQALALHGDESLAEELVHPADHQHRDPLLGQIAEPISVLIEVLGDPYLPGVLSTTTQDHIGAFWPPVPWGVVVHHGGIAVPAQPRGQTPGVAKVAVDAHFSRI